MLTETLLADRRFTAVHNGCTQPFREFFRELIGLVTSIDIDGFASRVNDDFAVMARAEMLFDLDKQFGIDLPVEVIG